MVFLVLRIVKCNTRLWCDTMIVAQTWPAAQNYQQRLDISICPQFVAMSVLITVSHFFPDGMISHDSVCVCWVYQYRITTILRAEFTQDVFNIKLNKIKF